MSKKKILLMIFVGLTAWCFGYMIGKIKCDSTDLDEEDEFEDFWTMDEEEQPSEQKSEN